MKFYVAKMTGLSIISSLIIIFNLIFAESSLNGAISGLMLCGRVIIPSLFPFCCVALFCFKSGVVAFLSRLLSPVTQRLFKLNGEQFCVFLMSFLAGYPVGVKLIGELYEQGRIEVAAAKRMALYSVNAGPAFILVAIGQGVLNDKTAGTVIFISNVLATLITLLFAEWRHTPTPYIMQKQNRIPLSDAFVSAVAESAASVFKICAWVILFSALLASLNNTFIPEFLQRPLLYLCEVTTAVTAAQRHVPLIAAIIGFGGFSVHCQIYSVGRGISPKYIKFLAFRVLHSVLSFGICTLILKCLKRSLSTISNHQSFSSHTITFTYSSALALIFMTVVFMASVFEEKRKLQ